MRGGYIQPGMGYEGGEGALTPVEAQIYHDIYEGHQSVRHEMAVSMLDDHTFTMGWL